MHIALAGAAALTALAALTTEHVREQHGAWS
jgi:hypothetical protein